MQNFVQQGDTVTLTAPAAVSSGDPVLVGGIFGVAVADAGSGAEVEIKTSGVFALPKAAVTISQGDALYWDAGSDVLTNVATIGFPQVAIATKGAIQAAATVEAKLDGAPSAPAASPLLGIKVAVIAGGAAGDHTVTGIAADDTLIFVKRYDIDTGAVVDVDDLTAEFTISAADTIENAGGSNTTGDKLEIWYAKV